MGRWDGEQRLTAWYPVLIGKAFSLGEGEEFKKGRLLPPVGGASILAMKAPPPLPILASVVQLPI